MSDRHVSYGTCTMNELSQATVMNGLPSLTAKGRRTKWYSTVSPLPMNVLGLIIPTIRITVQVDRTVVLTVKATVPPRRKDLDRARARSPRTTINLRMMNIKGASP